MKTLAPVLAFVFLAQAAVPACSCGPKKSVPDAFAECKVIFVGRCVSGKVASKQIKDFGLFEYRQFTFEVTRGWKGVGDKKQITVSTGAGYGDCGVQYELGESYIVYCAAGEDELATNICMRGCMDGGPDAETEKKALDGVARTATP